MLLVGALDGCEEEKGGTVEVTLPENVTVFCASALPIKFA